MKNRRFNKILLIRIVAGLQKTKIGNKYHPVIVFLHPVCVTGKKLQQVSKSKPSAQ
jgi:hypothetical protein